MKVLVVGSGGREHAICWKLAQSPRVTQLFCAPGNGGIAQTAQCVDVKAADVDGMVRWAKEHAMDFVVVAPDDPLALGMVDALEDEGFPCFGPRKSAAVIEGSKAFAKDLMKKYGIPTAAYEAFSDPAAALAYVDACPLPVVVKADGLALGKGVLICETRDAAREAVRSMMEGRVFGDSGATVDFTQGLDARFVTEEIAVMLNDIKAERLHFAFDFMKNEKAIIKGLSVYKEIVGGGDSKQIVYILTNFNTTIEQDLYRVQAVRKLGFLPDIRIYRKNTAPQIIRDLQRWCNNRILFRTCEFMDYVPRKDGKTIREIYFNKENL